jgi:hypothetical protein
MADRLFKTGKYVHVQVVPQQDGILRAMETEGTLSQLHGMLGHIWSVDVYNWRIRGGLKSEDPVENASKAELKILASKERLYRRFLIYRNIYVAAEPTIICEGKTDNIYLRHAIKSLAADFPLLATVAQNERRLIVKLFQYPQTSTGRIMGLTGGTGCFKAFIEEYEEEQRKFTAPGMGQPVILLTDRDDGASGLLNLLKNKFKKNTDPENPFIHIFGNLYVITTPLSPGQESSFIEDCFHDETKAVEIDGKKFKIDKKHGQNEKYFGKVVFARHIESNATTTDFSGFFSLLSRISAAIESHKATHPNPQMGEEPLVPA